MEDKKKLQEITVFAYGDSTKISTWSNVPFLLTTTLEKKGIVVNRVNINPSYRAEELFNKTITRLVRLFLPKTDYSYFRSFLFRLETELKIRKAINQNPNSDAFLFMCFDFSASKFTKKISVNFGDWTYERYITYFLNKKPDMLEKRFVLAQEKVIEQSAFTIALFPGMAESLQLNGHRNVKYLGNVINSIQEPDEKAILPLKQNSQKLLFIGSEKYKLGAIKLISAFKTLKTVHPNLSLHFIGIKAECFEELPSDVHFYGYLDKANSEHRKVYYDLLTSARCFINTTEKWSSFSASVEAMYFYTPVIVPPYEEFKNTFSDDFSAGFYCNHDSELPQLINAILSNEGYMERCKEANRIVKHFSWDAYSGKLLDSISDTLTDF